MRPSGSPTPRGSLSVEGLDRVVDRLGDDPPVADEEGVGAVTHTRPVGIRMPFEEPHLAPYDDRGVLEGGVGQLSVEQLGQDPYLVDALEHPEPGEHDDVFGDVAFEVGPPVALGSEPQVVVEHLGR